MVRPGWEGREKDLYCTKFFFEFSCFYGRVQFPVLMVRFSNYWVLALNYRMGSKYYQFVILYTTLSNSF